MFFIVSSIIYATNINVSATKSETITTEVAHTCHFKHCLPICPKCRLSRASNTGHCKNNGRLFNCNKKNN